MDETVCSVEIVKNDETYMAKVETGQGRYIEYENRFLENLLQQVYEDISEEVESTY